MQIKKYSSTTYKGKVITEVRVSKDFDGSAIIHLMDGPQEVYHTPLWQYYDEVKDFSADYLLCDIQDTKDLELRK